MSQKVIHSKAISDKDNPLEIMGVHFKQLIMFLTTLMVVGLMVVLKKNVNTALLFLAQ